MRTALRVPWDVPVRLVAGSASPRSEPAVRSVAVGRDLPGVGAVRVTTVHHRGRAHLARIEPVTSEAADAAQREGDLSSLLTMLAEEDGSVPVVTPGTAFTLGVLGALVRVPPGERITYAALAAAAGRPRAFRAVATVMARNRVPLVLPCHRVVPSSGGPGRYGWGDAVKVALLDAEATR